jgi:copper oxidase (laccase) domain-containing protein
MEALRPIHDETLEHLDLAASPLATCEQVHGAEVAVLSTPPRSRRLCFPGADAVITNLPGTVLGIYVADCCAVYLVDPVARVIGLAHSGAKGTKLGIVPRTIQALCSEFGAVTSRLIAVLSPCIRPPWYEVDFAAEIRSQCTSAGVRQVFDCGACTASNPDRFYSYRRELGKTGRMLALLSFDRGIH